MKLRSPSSKGKEIIEIEESSDEEKEIIEIESSDEEKESQIAATSDSDYMDNLGEDFSESLVEDGVVFSNLNVDPTDNLMLMEEDLDETVPKRRKVGPGSRGRRQRMKEEVQNQVKPANETANAELFVPNFDEGGKQDVSENKKPIEKKKGRKRKDRPILMWKLLEEENERWLDENEDKSVDLDDQNKIQAESVEAPNTLVMPLLKYQKEWLAWALRQEKSTGGGILADEMGMGKTVQAIALVLAKKEIRRECCSFIPSVPSSSTPLPAVKGTLVICPLVAVRQWEDEINRFTLKGSCLVFAYHGSNRIKDVGELSKYDFVITNYSIVSADYRKNIMPPKQKCERCGKLLYECNLTRHWTYFCGPNARRTSNQSKQQRKTPKLEKKMLKQNLLSDDDEADDSDGETSKGYKKGAKGNRGYKAPINDLSTNNFAGSNQSKSPRKSILHSVNWDRVILDEAHCINNRLSNTTRAILALRSSFKWALTGTPLQNCVDELHSLVCFLEIVPYSYYLCKDCNCRILDYNSSCTDCPHCPHKLMRHFSWWKKYISSPMSLFGDPAQRKRAMLLLKKKILRTILLRRTKQGKASDLGLPPRMVTIRRDSLDIKEKDYYTTLYKESQAKFNTYDEARTLMNNYAHIFDLLIRLRQAVVHPYLVVYSTTAVGNSEQVCGLCHETAEEAVVTSCTHVFCKSCLIDLSPSMGQVLCPSCSKPFTVDFTGSRDNEDKMSKTKVEGFKRSSILNKLNLDDFQTSTKIDALKEEIRVMIERDGSAKGLVFSQFLTFLDLIRYSLQKSGVCCVQLVGTMTKAAKDAAIKKFTDDPECRIFLISLKTGGVALNLTVASHVFLMDPWWNPAVEKQAQDRIYRIGQYKPMRIVRFIMKNTIEERILKLQEKKELVFEGTVGDSAEAYAKLSEADFRYLFKD